MISSVIATPCPPIFVLPPIFLTSLRQWYFLLLLTCIHSFIHSGHFYSASSSPRLLRSASDTARKLCRSFTPKHQSQHRVKDLSKVSKWRLERDSNPPPSTLPMCHYVPRPSA